LKDASASNKIAKKNLFSFMISLDGEWYKQQF